MGHTVIMKNADSEKGRAEKNNVAVCLGSLRPQVCKAVLSRLIFPTALRC